MYRGPLSFRRIQGKGSIGDFVWGLLRTDSHERKEQKLPMDLEHGDGIVGDGIRERVNPGLGQQKPAKKKQQKGCGKLFHGFPLNR
jgi:hypothetical protein